MDPADRYNVIKNGKPLGPFTLQELLSAKLGQSDMVQLPNGQWVPVSQSPAAGRVGSGAVGAALVSLLLVVLGAVTSPLVAGGGLLLLAIYTFATRRPTAGIVYLGAMMLAIVLAILRMVALSRIG